jgi:S-adenosylmethionine hydrolase
MNHIITLTTDWGLADNSSAIFKALLLKELNNTPIVDISHQIAPFNVEMGTYLLDASYRFFPKGSLHVFDVDYLNSSQEQTYVLAKQKNMLSEIYFTDYLAVKWKGHYFFAKNNGFFSLICNPLNEIEEIVKLPKVTAYDFITNFKTIAYFMQPLITLSKKQVSLSQVGENYDITRIEELKPRKPFTKKVDDIGDVIEFGVRYVDNYGNIITDLHKDLFDKVANGRKRLNIYIKGMEVYSVTLVDSYDDVLRNDKMVVSFNHCGYLEIASKFGRLALVLDITNSKIFDFRFKMSFKDRI